MDDMFGPAQDYRFEEEDRVLAFMWAAGGPVDYYRDATAEAPGAAEINAIPPDAIQLDLQGLADTYSWSVEPGFPPSPGPGGGGMPPHILLTFDGETPEEAQSNNGRRLYIFPSQAYIDLYNAEGNSIVEDQVVRLEGLIAGAATRQAAPDSPMPLLPPPSSFMDRWAQFLDLNFGVGQGVRYVSDSPYRQAIGPWTNETTGYYYEGLTDNGVFYVSLYWPVATASLPDTEADASSEVQSATEDAATYQAYIQETRETLDALTPAEWTPDLSQLDAMVQSLTFPTGPEPTLTGTTWQWVSLTDPVSVTSVDDPSLYTILFNEDGTAAIQADCNSASATYTVEGSSISLTLGPSTLAACSPDSLSQPFLAALENVTIYFFEEGDLFMDLVADSGTMRFTTGETGAAVPPEAAEGEAVGRIIAPDGVFIRSGPGTDYPTIGTVAFDETVDIVGKSEDGQWWAIALPGSPGAQGWIAAEYVEASNVENVPVVEAPSLEAGLTGTSWEWVSLSDPTGQTTVDDPALYTILFNSDGSATIRADCNSVGATYTVEENRLSITLGPTTLAACPPGSLDQEYLTALENVALYFFQEGDLFMDMAADGGTLRFRPAQSGSAAAAVPPTVDSAQGIEFQLASFGPEDAQETVLPGTTITASFTDTEVTGSAGCNDYTGTLTPVSDYFTVGPIATTSQSCSEPAGIMEQEQAYLQALGATDGFRWVTQLVNEARVITAGQLFYTLGDGTSGIINYIAP
jgi:heat shock protein HslJ